MNIYGVAMEAIMQCFLMDENYLRTGEDTDLNNCPKDIASFFATLYDEDGDGRADEDKIRDMNY